MKGRSSERTSIDFVLSRLHTAHILLSYNTDRLTSVSMRQLNKLTINRIYNKYDSQQLL